jgi:hypothetical protein
MEMITGAKAIKENGHRIFVNTCRPSECDAGYSIYYEEDDRPEGFPRNKHDCCHFYIDDKGNKLCR